MLIACACLFTVVPLSACSGSASGEPTGDGGHTCSFEGVWSKDATYHFHKCEDDTCDETADKATHNLVEYVCSVCGYEAERPSAVITYENYYNTAKKMEGTYVGEGADRKYYYETNLVETYPEN
ncbi:MAG: hypothetical protein IJ329_02365 [Clostridia bacterium]|nr:hypothetical protein [Clostridia bacterium]